MIDVVTIAGSPADPSRCATALDTSRDLLERRGLSTAAIALRDLPPKALVWAQADDPAIQRAVSVIAQARAVVVATPVYKASYSGLLKSFLDLLPANALAGKTVLPIATAGSLAHMLVLEYAFKPVLAALGATTLLPGVCLVDADFVTNGRRFARLETAAGGRLAVALDALEAAARFHRENAPILLEVAI